MAKTPEPAPGVSVLIVNYNAGALLGQAVERALRQAETLEVVVCDNASADASLDSLPDSQRLRLIRNPSNLGFSAANNRAVAAARGAWLLFLNPDCLLAPGALSRLCTALAQDPGCGMVGGRILNPDGAEQKGGRRNLPNLRGALTKALDRSGRANRMDRIGETLPAGPVSVEAISGACMLVRREALAAVGPWDEGYFLHCEDLDLCRRFGDRGWRILFVPDAELIHHQGACSGDRPLFVEWHKHRSMLRYYRKFMLRSSFLLAPLVYAGVLARFGWVALRHWRGGADGR